MSKADLSLQDLPIQKQSDLVQDFYQSFAEYFRSECRSVRCASVFLVHEETMLELFSLSGFPEAQVTQIMEHVEKLIMTRLHKWVFCHDSCDDEQKDLALQRRIR